MLFVFDQNLIASYLLHPYISSLGIKIKIYTFPNQSSKNLLKKEKSSNNAILFLA